MPARPKVAMRSSTAEERVATAMVFMVASRKRSLTEKMRPACARLRPKRRRVSMPRSESMKWLERRMNSAWRRAARSCAVLPSMTIYKTVTG